MVRAKFVCNLEERSKQYDGKYLSKFKFNPVSGGSEENKKFFGSTPSGCIELGVVNEDVKFELGKEYYIDFNLAV